MEQQGKFSHQSVRLARTARGLSQSALARKLDVSQPLVSQWEDGNKTPGPELLESLVQELEFPRAFFFTHIPYFGPGVGEVFHRRRKITEGEKSAYYSWASIKSNVIQTLLEAVEWPESAVMIADATDTDSAIAAARLLRAKWGLPIGPIESVSDVLASAGVLVIPEWDISESMDGMSVWRNGQCPMIFINANMPVDRLRFTLAHELGHLVLHHRSEIYDLSPSIEEQAHAFASEFLMPAEEIRSHLRSIDHRSLTLLKRHWKVSRSALVMRARTLGVMSGSAAEKIWKDMSKRGWMKNEPDPLTGVSEPIDRSIREIFNLNNEIGRLSPSNIERVFGLSPAEFRARILPPGVMDSRPSLRAVK